MALATQCPHCGTMFRVAADQLKLRGGIVRCGACQLIFDGNSALVDLAGKPAPASAPAPAPAAPAAPAPAAATMPSTPAPDAAQQDKQPQDSQPQDKQAQDGGPGTETPVYTLELDNTFAPLGILPQPTAEDAAPPPPVPATPAEPPVPAARTGSALPFDLAEFDPPVDLEEPVRRPDDWYAVPGSIKVGWAQPRPAPLPRLDIEPAAGAIAPAAPPAPLAPAPAPAPAPQVAPEVPAQPQPALQPLTEPTPAPKPAPEPKPEPEPAPAPEPALAPEPEPEPEPAPMPPSEPAPEPEPAPAPAPEPEPRPKSKARPRPAPEPTPDAAAEATFEPIGEPARDKRFDADGPPTLLLRESASGPPTVSAAQGARSQRARAAEARARRTKTPPPVAAIEEQTKPPEPPKQRASDADVPEFVRRGRQRERSGKAVRIAMAAGSVLLVAALATQAMVSFRDVLAARYPAVRPALAATCDLFGCAIGLPARPDQLVIETGELLTLGGGAYTFDTLLRNQGDMALAWPSLELTLNDADGKPLVRRVFGPDDYLGAQAAPAFANGFGANAEQPVKIHFRLEGLEPSGYRIAVFYP